MSEIQQVKRGTLVRHVPMRLVDVSLSGCLVEAEQDLDVGTPTERGRRSAADASTRDSLKARISWPAGGASTPRASCARASASNRRALSRCVRGMALNHADSST